MNKELNEVSAFKAGRSEQYLAAQIRLEWLSCAISLLKISTLATPFVGISHSHSNLEILYVISGEGWMHIHDAEVKTAVDLYPGMLLFTGPRVPHHIESSSRKPLRVCIISFIISPLTFVEARGLLPPEWIAAEQYMVNRLANSKVLFAEDKYGIREILEQLESHHEEGRVSSLVKIKCHSSLLLSNAIQSLIESPHIENLSDHYKHAYSEHMIVEYVKAHFTEDITIQDLAREFHYSVRHCQRIISESMGVSFSELLIDIRVSAVKNLLSTTDHPLELIAEQSGFKSVKALTQCFKKATGVTPYKFRRLSRNGSACDGEE